MNKILLIFMLSLAATKGLAVNYYNKSSGASNLQTLSNWGTNTDGTGTAPTSFSTTGNVFYIRNGTTATIGAAWSVGTGSKIVLGDATVAAITFTIPSGFALSSLSTIDIAAASASGSNTLVIQNGTIPTFGTLDASSTVNYNSTAAQTIKAANYGNLTISGTRTTNSVIIPTGTIGIAGTFNPSATFTSGTYAVNTNSTIDFNGTTSQTIPASTSFKYNNLTISGTRASGTVLTLASGTISIAGNGSFTAGGLYSWVNTGNTVNYTKAGAHTVAAFYYNNLTVSGSKGNNVVTFASTGTIGIAGTFTLSNSFTGSGSYLTTGSTFDYNGTGSQTILAQGTPTTGNTNTFTYNNLTLSGARGTATITLASGNLYIIGNAENTATGTLSYTNTGSVVEYKGTGSQTIASFDYYDLKFTGARTAGAIITLPDYETIGIAGAFTYSSTNVSIVNDNNEFNYNGTGSQSIALFTYNDLRISGARSAATITLPSGTIYVQGYGFFEATGTYTFSNSGNTVEYNGTAEQYIGAFEYNNLTVSGNKGGNFVALEDNKTTKISGDFTISATNLTWNSGIGGTVDYNGTGDQTVQCINYWNLTLSNNRTGKQINFSTDGVIGVAGNLEATATFTSASNKYVYYGSTFEFNGDMFQSINTNDYFKFYNLTINNSSSDVNDVVDYYSNDVVGVANQHFIDGTLTLTQGRLDLSRIQLILSGDLGATGTGSIRGEPTSSLNDPYTELYIEGDGALTGSLRMDQTTPGTTNFLTNLIYNRSGTSTLKLESDIGILNFCNIGCDNGGVTISTDGRVNMIDMNGNTVTIGGAIHPTSGTYPNYKFKGGSTSKFVFMYNSEYLGNTRFYMDQTTPGTTSSATNYLESISIDRRDSRYGIFIAPNGAYGNPVTVGSITFASTSNSYICLNSNELTLTGNISGMNASNVFRSRNSNSGGLSRLNIAGSGALSSSLYFDQTAVTLGRDVLVGTGSIDDLTTLTTTAADSCNNFNRLTINRSGQTITLGNKIAISGKVVPTAGTLASAGNLVMLSSNTITSNIDKITSGTSAITGDVVVQSFFLGGTGSSPRGFRMISFPVQEKSSPNNLVKIMQNRFIITGTSGATNGFDPGGTKQPNAVTLMSYNEPASTNATSYNFFPNISSAVSQGLGYFFFFRGNRSNSTTTKVNDTNGVFADPESWTATYTGTINSGDISQAVTLTNNSGDNYNGYNLLGNPYPCTIDFELLRADNTSTLGAAAANGTLCILRRDRVGYITRSGGVSNNTAYPGSTSTGSGSEIRYIQPGQGFMVKAVASGTVTFKETHKVPDQAPARMLSTPVKDGGIKLNGKANGNNSYALNEAEAPRQLLRISIEKGEKYEQATLVLEPGNEDKYAGADAIYFGGNDVMLNTLTSDNINTCINFLPEINKVDSVKLFVNSVSNLDSIKLNFTELTALGGDYAILLKDNYLQKETRIGEGVNEYYFSIDKANTGTFGNSRFVMVFVPKSVLSVKLKSFTAKKNSNLVDLNWVTINEESNKRFDIERSIDGKKFVKIGEKFGAGNSSDELSYHFTDNEPVNGNNYYRIKSVDVNNNPTFSEIRVVNFSLSNDEALISFYPNPVINEFNASWNFEAGELFTIKIVDINGSVIETINTVTNKLKHSVSKYPKGIYFIEIIGNKGTTSKNKFVKN